MGTFIELYIYFFYCEFPIMINLKRHEESYLFCSALFFAEEMWPILMDLLKPFWQWAS